MVDTIGRQGGASDVRVVANSNDRSCLNDLSPSSTSMTQTSTQSQVTQKPSKTVTSSSSSLASVASSSVLVTSRGSSAGAIAGTVIGTLLFLAVVVTLGLFFLKKRREAKILPATTSGFSSYDGQSAGGYSLSSTAAAAYAASSYTHTFQTHNQMPYGTELSSGHAYQSGQHMTSSYAPSSQNLVYSHNQTTSISVPGAPEGSVLPYDENPFLDDPHSLHQFPAANLTYQSQSAIQLPSVSTSSLLHPSDPFNPPTTGRRQESFAHAETVSTIDSSIAPTHRKATLEGVSSYKSPSHIIVHTDAEDDLPPPNVDGIVELPPQYTERRVGGLAVVNQSPPSSVTQPH